MKPTTEQIQQIQSAIKGLDKAIEWIEPIRAQMTGVGRIKHMMYHAKSILEELEAGDAHQRDAWIAVSEALPNEMESVIVRTLYYHQQFTASKVDVFIGYIDEYGELMTCPECEPYGWKFADCVTHWQPLPSPPQTESK